MVVITQARDETAPLLATSRKGSRSLVGALGVAALFAIALVAISTSRPQRVVLSGDGVVPADQLSFTQGEKVHFAAPKKLGDVAARVAMAGYFDKIGAHMNEEHQKAEKESSKDARSALNDYFNSLGQKYHQLAQQEKGEREMVHPGKLDHKRAKDDEVMAKDEAIITSKIQEGKADEVEKKEAAPKEKISWAEPLRNAKAQEKASLAITDKVKVNFYMESMCPGCKYFTTHVLSTLLQDNDFNQMVEFKLVPYGNGQLMGGTPESCKASPGGCSVACQHGDPECEGNQILACLQHYHPITASDTGFVPTFSCMEGKDGLPKDEFADCATTNGLDQAAQDKVLQCAASGEGHELAVLAGVDTETLEPKHEYAPWVTLNGKPLRDDAYELQEQVCGAFKGTAPASMCSSSELSSIQQSLHNIGFSICPKEAGVV